ncbi:MAG: hypothetical protein AAFR91_01740 [Pseudomonadota bacterium]
MMIYFDMDGVIADFEKGIQAKYGEPFSKMHPGKFWNQQVGRDQVFLDLPSVPTGLELLRGVMATKAPVSILTSTGGGKYHYTIAQEKLAWLERHEIKTPVCFCLNTASKASFSLPDTVLLDDRDSVVAKFNEGSGTAYRFPNEIEQFRQTVLGDNQDQGAT